MNFSSPRSFRYFSRAASAFFAISPCAPATAAAELMASDCSSVAKMSVLRASADAMSRASSTCRRFSVSPRSPISLMRKPSMPSAVLVRPVRRLELASWSSLSLASTAYPAVVCRSSPSAMTSLLKALTGISSKSTAVFMPSNMLLRRAPMSFMSPLPRTASAKAPLMANRLFSALSHTF